MKKIIYIMAPGRSGTTLLDIILGNNPDIFSAGELNRFTEYKGKPVRLDNESETAIFWKTFAQRLPMEWQQDEFTGIHKICRKFEYHAGIFRYIFPLFNKSRLQYKNFLVTFFNTLAPMVTKPVLIDSSKYPLRGYYMGMFLPYEVCYIYVKRNPLGMLRSYAKKGIEQPSQGWLMTNIFMFVVNLICINVIKKVSKKHKSITIRYDDLVADPEQTLDNIGKALQIDINHSQRQIRNKEPLKPGLLFDGNRIRLEREILVNTGKKEAGPESLGDRITMLIQYPWWN